MIGLAEKEGPRGGTIIYFKVENIHAVYDALLARKVEFVDAPHLIARMPDHELWMVFLKDPDGNVLGVMSEVPLS
jgi:methylmalonyl-CoA/ethylmalonyl-CoA epimerase